MQTDLFSHCQRWNSGRSSYRPAGEPFSPSRCFVAPIDEREAKVFVKAHHYSGTYPAARFRAGIFHKPSAFEAERLAGVAVFSVPMTQSVIPSYFPSFSPSQGVELGRFVLLDELAANAETWFLSRAFKLLRSALPGVHGVLSYSDPVPRIDREGRTVFPGHRGTIYKAFNGCYRGRATPRTLRLAPCGQVVSDRLLSKIRNEEVGVDYALRQLAALGAPARQPFESGRQYLSRISPEFFRPMRHEGNLAFTWNLPRQPARKAS
jgi:hypothetical protein